MRARAEIGLVPEWYQDRRYLFGQRDIPLRPRRTKCGVFGNARLARPGDLTDLLTPPEGQCGSLAFDGVALLLEAAPDGSRLEPFLAPRLTISESLRERHVLVIGNSGGGKTMRIVLPALASDLANPGRSVIALDAKGGVLYPFLSALAGRVRPGTTVRCINMKQPDRGNSVWNPVSRPLTRARAMEVSHSVCLNVNNAAPGIGGSNEAFWLFSSVNLLADILLALADNPDEPLSLARAKSIADLEVYGLAVFADNHPHSKEFAKRYPAITRVLERSSHQTQQCVVADLAMRLELFGDEGVMRATCEPDDLDLPGLVSAGGVLVIDTPEAYCPVKS